MDDAQLVTAAATGDRQALAGIYNRYADRIHDFSASILRDADEAADVTSETFLKAAQHLGDLREPAKLRSWLFAVARHEALARIRTRKRAVPTEELADTPSAEAEDEMAAPERLHDEGELREIVWQAAAGLNEADRVVLDLNVRQGLSGQELADAVGVSENAANVRLHRMKERFERAVGALLVARQGRSDCDDLRELLGGWDGTFSPLIRKRVARHVDRCETCGAQRRSLTSPLALLATVPALPAPEELRETVLGRVEHVSHVSGLPDGWTRAGFPPSLFGRARRRSLAAALLAALLLAGLALFAGVTGGDDTIDDEARLAGDDRFAGAATTSTTATTTTTTSTTSTTTTTTPAVPAAGSGSATPDPGPISERTGDATPTTSSTATVASTTTTTTTTTTQPPDETGPSIGTITADPSQVRENGGEFCPNNHTATVSATVDDPSGVDSVTLSWSVGNDSGSTAMSHAGGSTYEATVGNWSPDTVDQDTPVSLTVAATDGEGNPSSSSSSNALTLVDCY